MLTRKHTFLRREVRKTTGHKQQYVLPCEVTAPGHMALARELFRCGRPAKGALSHARSELLPARCRQISTICSRHHPTPRCVASRLVRSVYSPRTFATAQLILQSVRWPKQAAMSSPDEVFVGSIDQGTTSTRFLIFDKHGEPVAIHQEEFGQIYPNPGYADAQHQKHTYV